MNKEVIIDGVNVAGCGAYMPDLGKYNCIALCNNSSATCEGSPNCDYKQLQRTQAQYNEVVKQNKSLQTELQKAKHEFVELKKYKDVVNKLAGMQVILTNKDKMPELYNNAKDLKLDHYKHTLEKIEEIAKQGLKPICYKSNCNRCQCYDGDDSKIAITNLINEYFTEDGFVDDDRDFYEALEGLVENERASCNKAKPISERILTIINEVKDAD